MWVGVDVGVCVCMRVCCRPAQPNHHQASAHLNVSITSAEAGVKGMVGGTTGRRPISSVVSHSMRWSSPHSA